MDFRYFGHQFTFALSRAAVAKVATSNREKAFCQLVHRDAGEDVDVDQCLQYLGVVVGEQLMFSSFTRVSWF